MSAISIIHAPGDAGLGDQIAEALSRDGHRIKRHDGDPLSGDLDLENNLAIVVWSKAAARLARIHDQAREALARGALIPVAVGDAPPPRGFEELPPVDLSGWAGEPEDPRWRFVLGEIDFAAHRNILEDGAVWAGPPETPGDDAVVPATAIVSDADWPPESEVDLFDDDYSGELDEEEIPASLQDYSTRYQKSGFSTLHVAMSATLGMILLTGAAALLAPRFMTTPDQRIARTAAATAAQTQTPAQAPAQTQAQTPAQTSAETSAQAQLQAEPQPETPATLAFVQPAAMDADGNALSDEDQAAAAPAAADTIADSDSGAEIETESVLSAPSQTVDSMDALVAAVTAEDGSLEETPEETTLSAEEAANLIAQGDYFKDCEDCPDMAALGAGRFLMGSPESEPARLAVEGPVVETAIDASFAISAREVTFAQWQACVSEGGCKGYAPYDHGWGRDERPVIRVSFDDAEAYAAWLSAKTGQAYRLPTEAEWEYAARAGSSDPFSFGRTVSTDQANFNGEHAYGVEGGVNRAQTTPTASFAPNAFGLFDMHGNVWEWTADCWAETPGAPGAGDCSQRVMKGGAWNTGGWRLRSAHRIGKEPTAREYDNGFRVARDVN